MKGKFLRACLNKWKKMGSGVIHCGGYGSCHCCEMWSCMHERDSIPNDVPKGHLVVYVGENHKRYVINIALLNHPLFKALLDQAQDEYDFIAHSKLYIPCNEHLFLTVLRSATSPYKERVFLRL
ncbi:auxin-responsive protein SAUR50-like [Abrus precatorius]|uniref:Auxin-responsive protein SAUR50-like n=1 Tax=Abrus precatorius TaxID=3816 RepID=A0A8B8LAR4_ABRPR|nr:auxin-responsive protein SAUR50-like [Abrus precatorius]